MEGRIAACSMSAAGMAVKQKLVAHKNKSAICSILSPVIPSLDWYLWIEKPKAPLVPSSVKRRLKSVVPSRFSHFFFLFLLANSLRLVRTEKFVLVVDKNEEDTWAKGFVSQFELGNHFVKKCVHIAMYGGIRSRKR